jgi:hypothetical protein
MWRRACLPLAFRVNVSTKVPQSNRNSCSTSPLNKTVTGNYIKQSTIPTDTSQMTRFWKTITMWTTQHRLRGKAEIRT